MMTPQPPRLALWLLYRFGPPNAPLVGDLLELFAHRQSRLWFWGQVIPAVASALLHPSGDIRPLELVEQQPFEAIERTIAMHRRRRAVSPTPSPLPGGLGLVILGGLITALAPVIWMGLVLTTLAGSALAAVLVSVHRRHAPPSARRRLIA